MRRGLWAALVVAVIGAGAPAVVDVVGEVFVLPRAEPVADSYLVSLPKTLPGERVEPTARELARRYGGTLGHVYTTVCPGSPSA